MKLTVYTNAHINALSAEWSFRIKHRWDEIHHEKGVLTGDKKRFAHWFALGYALRYLHDNHEADDIVLYCTSVHIVKRIRGTIHTPKPLVALRDRCRELALEIPKIEIEWMSEESISALQRIH